MDVQDVAVGVLEPDSREAVAPVHAAVDVHARARSGAFGPVDHGRVAVWRQASSCAGESRVV